MHCRSLPLSEPWPHHSSQRYPLSRRGRYTPSKIVPGSLTEHFQWSFRSLNLTKLLHVFHWFTVLHSRTKSPYHCPAGRAHLIWPLPVFRPASSVIVSSFFTKASMSSVLVSLSRRAVLTSYQDPIQPTQPGRGLLKVSLTQSR